MRIETAMERFEYDRRLRDLHNAWGERSRAQYDLAIEQIVWGAFNRPSSRITL